MLFLLGGINSLGVDSAMLIPLLPFLRDGIDNDDNDDDGNNVDDIYIMMKCLSVCLSVCHEK